MEEIIGEQYRFREIFEGPANEKSLGNIIRAQLNINSLEIELKIKEEISSYDSKTLAELEKAVAILMSKPVDRAPSNAIKTGSKMKNRTEHPSKLQVRVFNAKGKHPN